MALSLGDVITAVRDRHSSFHKSRVPDAVLARSLTRYQRRLISKTADIEPSLVAQQASIVFAADSENAIGVVGAGTSGGLPGDLTSGGAPVALNENAGPLVEMDTEDAPVLVAETPVSSATATTLTKTGAAWTVNAFAGKVVVITAGTGAIQRREIQSNTAETLTLKTGTQWETLPDTTSMFKIVTPVLELTKGMDVVTELLPIGRRQGYLVRLDASGVPYLDLGKPLVAHFDQGIDLPPHESIIGGTVRKATAGRVGDLNIRPYRHRRQWQQHSCWIENAKLFLVGGPDDWKDIDSIDLRYVPIAPAFTALADLFLLPDTAYDALVAYAALEAGERVNSLPDAPKADLDGLGAEASEAEATFLNGVGRHGRSFVHYVEDVWP